MISHNFSLSYNSVINGMTNLGPRYDLKVFVVANPDVLEKIQKVEYGASPKFTGTNTPYVKFYNGSLYENVSTANNNFTLDLNVYAGPKINATVYFKDGLIINYPKILQTLTPCPSNICDVSLNINPRINGLNIKIDGVVFTKYTKISKILINWGDGTSSETKNHIYSLTHKYTKDGSYTVTIITTTTMGVKYYRNLQTSILIAEQNIPSNSSVKLSAKSNALMQIFTSSSSIEADKPITFVIHGRLTSLNGLNVYNIPININILWIDNPSNYNSTLSTNTTNSRGDFMQTRELNLDQGKYMITALPADQKYSDLNSNQGFDAKSPPDKPVTRDQYITYSFAAMGTGVAILGGITQIPKYLSSKKQTNNFLEDTRDLYGIYNKFNNKEISNDQYTNFLENYRESFINQLSHRDINEDQFKLLDDITLRYINNAR